MGLNLLLIPLMALARAIIGWLENAAADWKIDLPEWRKFGETILRMSIPIFGLMWVFNLDPASACGIGLIIDWIVVKIYKTLKKEKK